MGKRLLLVIDMQNDFIDGALGTAEAKGIVPKVKERIEESKERGDKIVFTRDTHGKDYLKTPEGRKLPVEHCMRGTSGWQVADGLVPENYDCHFVDKPNFGWLRWADVLPQYGLEEVTEIELIGICTDICVVSNALILKAAFPEAEVIVDAACCAGTTPENHQAALITMKNCQVTVRNE